MKNVPLKVDQIATVGQHTKFWPTDVDASGVRIVLDGQIMGGPDDGQPQRREFELPIGGAADVGPLLKITLVKIVGPTAHFGVMAPSHTVIRKLKDAQPPRSE